MVAVGAAADTVTPADGATLSYGELVCAQQHVAQHGDDAAVQASMRADALLVDGDLAGQQTWLAILKRINQLTVVGADEVRHRCHAGANIV
ncbi:MAG: hypothetical protein ACRYG4_10420 [Janthinobacterium lividum]